MSRDEEGEVAENVSSKSEEDVEAEHEKVGRGRRLKSKGEKAKEVKKSRMGRSSIEKKKTYSELSDDEKSEKISVVVESEENENAEEKKVPKKPGRSVKGKSADNLDGERSEAEKGKGKSLRNREGRISDDDFEEASKTDIDREEKKPGAKKGGRKTKIAEIKAEGDLKDQPNVNSEEEDKKAIPNKRGRKQKIDVEKIQNDKVIPKQRGRKAKVFLSDDDDFKEIIGETSFSKNGGLKGRGRNTKLKISDETAAQELNGTTTKDDVSDTEVKVASPKKRGRQVKKVEIDNTDEYNVKAPPKKRGRKQIVEKTTDKSDVADNNSDFSDEEPLSNKVDHKEEKVVVKRGRFAKAGERGAAADKKKGRSKKFDTNSLYDDDKLKQEVRIVLEHCKS